MDNFVSELSQLKEVNYSIVVNTETGDKEFIIDSASVYSMGIVWDINDILVEGNIIFDDTSRTLEILPPHSSVNLKIKLEDFTGYIYEEYFIISKIQKEVQGYSITTVKLDFVDEYFYNLSNTYISKGYNNKHFSEILDNLFSDVLNIFIRKEKTLNLSKTDKLYDNFCIPGNKSLLSLLYSHELKDNFLWISSRTNIALIKSNDIFNNSVDLTDSIIFTSENTQSLNPFEVKSLKILYSDKYNINSYLPDTISWDFNPSDKKVKKTGMSVDIAKYNIAPSSSNVNQVTTIGYKNYPYSENIINRLYNVRSIQNTTIEISVPGLFLYNLLYKVKVNIKTTIPGVSKTMPFISGDYIITRIVDNIQGTKFSQTLTLTKTGI